ncbi:MAG TPA: DUF5615 family PIN-like protein [Pirellulales bacterium]|jgi:predicted nuclease of predicted toxin-antitoxin system|nr:DUF5615 family PIN-like protein [Pirellulales bacterium]
MKLLLDHGLPRSTVKPFVIAGIAAEHVGDLGMVGDSDAAILGFARRELAVVVTFDADFRQLLAVSGASSPSVLQIRIEGLKGDELATVLIQAIAVAGAELAAGALVTVTRQQIHVRSLPIGG